MAFTEWHSCHTAAETLRKQVLDYLKEMGGKYTDSEGFTYELIPAQPLVPNDSIKITSPVTGVK